MLMFARRHDSPGFELIWGLTLGSLVIVNILWKRTWRRKYEQWRARNWPLTSGKFNNGEILPLVTGRTKRIAGYVVCLDYSYISGKPFEGVYLTRELPTREAAEQCLRSLEDQSIAVRIAPDKPHKSRILDRDLSHLLPPS